MSEELPYPPPPLPPHTPLSPQWLHPLLASQLRDELLEALALRDESVQRRKVLLIAGVLLMAGPAEVLGGRGREAAMRHTRTSTQGEQGICKDCYKWRALCSVWRLH